MVVTFSRTLVDHICIFFKSIILYPMLLQTFVLPEDWIALKRELEDNPKSVGENKTSIAYVVRLF